MSFLRTLTDGLRSLLRRERVERELAGSTPRRYRGRAPPVRRRGRHHHCGRRRSSRRRCSVQGPPRIAPSRGIRVRATRCRVDTARLFFLPGVAPNARLAEIRKTHARLSTAISSPRFPACRCRARMRNCGNPSADHGIFLLRALRFAEASRCGRLPRSPG